MGAYKGIKSLNFNASLSESGQLLIRPADEDCLSRERFAAKARDSRSPQNFSASISFSTTTLITHDEYLIIYLRTGRTRVRANILSHFPYISFFALMLCHLDNILQNFRNTNKNFFYIFLLCFWRCLHSLGRQTSHTVHSNDP